MDRDRMYGDLDRPPLRPGSLAHALAPDGWRVEVLPVTASTNAVVVERARAGEAAGLCVVAEEQTAGRGRLDRAWASPPRAGLTCSVLLRPVTDALGWVPLLAGLAVVRALRERAEVDAELKWPNDVLIGGRKVAGLLAEAVEGAVVVGLGLNVTTRPDELPDERATSLAQEGAATTDRDTLLRAVLRAMSFTEPDRAAYREACSTLGREVTVHLPGGEVAQGTAEVVDEHGRLVVGGTPYAAGDVVHLR
ncbi:MAG TPA: biotin--[acetyl-CoA-carboxylase] ligase [Mycobacteriales bacterium]|nr:biotin--[acetyl-CoA-carboxylase] ligase [Mycobacteriales bacterium]